MFSGVWYMKENTMQKLYFFLLTITLVPYLAGCASKANAQSQKIEVVEENSAADNPNIPANCTLTPNENLSFEPPAPYPANAPFPGEFWFGSEHLWTALPDNGVWSDLPHNPDGYTQKIFWWSSLFSLKDEPEPALVVFGERLDAKAPPLKVSKATNAFAEDIGTAMLVGVDFPTEGCWEITGRYKKSGLSFVIWVTP